MLFYKPAERDRSILPHDPFKALISPRPIGWISTLGTDGIPNLAPFSFFNAVASAPPLVMFCSNGATRPDGRKDSHRNAEDTGEFVVNVVSEAQFEAMHASSASFVPEIDEFEAVGLEKLPSNLVKPPRVKGAPAHFECKTERVVVLPSPDPKTPNVIVIGLVVGVHIDESIIADGRADVTRFAPVARLGYFDYTTVRQVFSKVFPA
jgi:flavin reductase (DIM6/NTAB) family NADH-FMN oxidoreductase RutF